MTCTQLNKERNPGHSSIVTGWNGGKRKKSNARTPFGQNAIFFVRENLAKKDEFWTDIGERETSIQPTPGKVSSKKAGTESLDRSQQKGADSVDSGDVTRP